MGLFDRIFGRGRTQGQDTRLNPQVQAWFESAAAKVGWRSVRWEGNRAFFEARGKQRFAGLDSLLASFVDERRTPSASDIAAYVRKLDGLLAADDERRAEARDLGRVQARLRPRLMTPDQADSNQGIPSIVYVPGELVQVLAIDYPDTSTFVNELLLGSWGVSFQDAWTIALQNLRSIATPSEFEALPDHPDILLCSTQDGIGSSRAFVLPDLFPAHRTPLGFLFSAPSSDVLLAHLIQGPASLAIPPLMLSLALPLLHSRPHPLNGSVFWRRSAETVRLNLSATKSRGGTMDINFVAAGYTQEFVDTLSGHS